MCHHRALTVVALTLAAAGATALSLGFTAQQGDGVPPIKPVPPAHEKPRSVPAPVVPGNAQEAPMPPEMVAAMESMTPGPEHLWLAEKVGDWTFVGDMWMGPGMTVGIRGTTTYRMILDGRFLVEDMKTTMMDQPMQGLGTTGYSRGTKEFQLTWIDSAGTYMTNGVGKRSADGSTLEVTYNMFDPMLGKVVKARSVEKRVDANTFSFTMYGPGPDGKETQMFKFDYTRKGATN